MFFVATVLATVIGQIQQLLDTGNLTLSMEWFRHTLSMSLAAGVTSAVAYAMKSPWFQQWKKELEDAEKGAAAIETVNRYEAKEASADQAQPEPLAKGPAIEESQR